MQDPNERTGRGGTEQLMTGTRAGEGTHVRYQQVIAMMIDQQTLFTQNKREEKQSLKKWQLEALSVIEEKVTNK